MASGVVFSLPVSLFIDVLGTAIALSVPYFIGRAIGPNTTMHIVKKYPKVQKITPKRLKNDFLFSFIVRLIGGLPTDIVSLFMGALKIDYLQYLLGGLLGLVPRMIIYSVIGLSVTDRNISIFL